MDVKEIRSIPTEPDYESHLLAIVLSSSLPEPGVRFVTPDNLSQQVGVLHHQAGTTIPPHYHRRVKREITGTTEVLVVQSGIVRVSFYDLSQRYVCDYSLQSGDVLILVDGGHGFEVMVDAVILEVKQGPYAGIDNDKVIFEPRK